MAGGVSGTSNVTTQGTSSTAPTSPDNESPKSSNSSHRASLRNIQTLQQKGVSRLKSFFETVVNNKAASVQRQSSKANLKTDETPITAPVAPVPSGVVSERKKSFMIQENVGGKLNKGALAIATAIKKNEPQESPASKGSTPATPLSRDSSGTSDLKQSFFSKLQSNAAKKVANVAPQAADPSTPVQEQGGGNSEEKTSEPSAVAQSFFAKLQQKAQAKATESASASTPTTDKQGGNNSDLAQNFFAKLATKAQGKRKESVNATPRLVEPESLEATIRSLRAQLSEAQETIRRLENKQNGTVKQLEVKVAKNDVLITMLGANFNILKSEFLKNIEPSEELTGHVGDFETNLQKAYKKNDKLVQLVANVDLLMNNLVDNTKLSDDKNDSSCPSSAVPSTAVSQVNSIVSTPRGERVEDDLGSASAQIQSLGAALHKVATQINVPSQTREEIFTSVINEYLKSCELQLQRDEFSRLALLERQVGQMHSRVKDIRELALFNLKSGNKSLFTAKPTEQEEAPKNIKAVFESLNHDFNEKEEFAAKTLQRIYRVYRTRTKLRSILWTFATSPHAKQARKRLDVIREILNTEKGYVNSLMACQKLLVKPLKALSQQKHSWVKMQDLDDLFLNWEQITTIHQVFLVNLEAKWENFPIVDVGEIFANLAPSFMAYGNYLPFKDKAQETLRRLRTINQFKEFCKDAKAKPEANNEPIESFLIKPVQRLPRYTLLLRELINCTYEEHYDYKKLQAAMVQIQKITTYINEQIREQQTSTACDTIRSYLEAQNYNKTDAIMQQLKDQSFIMDAMGSWTRSDKCDKKEKSLSERSHFFLFSHTLVVFKIQYKKGLFSSKTLKDLEKEKSYKKVYKYTLKLGSNIAFVSDAQVPYLSRYLPQNTGDAHDEHFLYLADSTSNIVFGISIESTKSDPDAESKWKKCIEEAISNDSVAAQETSEHLERYNSFFSS